MESPLESSLPVGGIPVTRENPMGSYRDPIVTGESESGSDSTSLESEDDDGVFLRTFQQRHPNIEKEPPLDIEPNYVPKLPARPGPDAEMSKLGHVYAIIDGVVIIKSADDWSENFALDKSTPVFFSDRRPLGFIYDTFGSIRSPMYAVVHENRAAKAGRELPKVDVNVEVRDEVYYDKKQIVKVIPTDLTKVKANDEELSDIDFSDDEEERIVKTKKRKSRGRSQSTGSSKHFQSSQPQPSHRDQGGGALSSRYGPSYQQPFQQQQQQACMGQTYSAQLGPPGVVPEFQQVPSQGSAYGLFPLTYTMPPPQYVVPPPELVAMADQLQQQQLQQQQLLQQQPLLQQQQLQQQQQQQGQSFRPGFFPPYRYPGPQGN
ncbi:hypothetical protein Aperf_G00000019056 [Anoplocephala perfoliata]